jgi:hypothetical protein
MKAICTCGWRSAQYQVYLGASTSWAVERARQQAAKAGSKHMSSLVQSP